MISRLPPAHTNTATDRNGQHPPVQGWEKSACGVCLEAIRPTDAIPLPCAHNLHRACFTQAMANDLRCPTCRNPIDIRSYDHGIQAEFYEHLSLIDPKNPNWHNQFALHTLQSDPNSTDRAFDALKKAVYLEPTAAIHWHNLFRQWPTTLNTLQLPNPLNNNALTSVSRLKAFNIVRQLHRK